MSKRQSKKKRKPNNNLARLMKAERAAMRTSKLAIWHVENGDRQGLINWSTGIKYRATDLVLDAMLERSHSWVIRLVALCQKQDGERYYKVDQFEPDGIHRHDKLTSLMRREFESLKQACNHKHVIGYAWMANPCGHWFTDDEADRLLEAVDAWSAPEPIQLVEPPRCHMKPMRLAGEPGARHWSCQHCSHTKPLPPQYLQSQPTDTRKAA